jgi:hypothetical protein
MKLLSIAATNSSPMVRLDPEGIMIIQGRSYIEDAGSFYKPIIEWVKNFNAHTLTLEIRLEYINKNSSTHIYFLLKSIQENNKIQKKSIKWLYEDDDEELFEMGKDYESKITIPFEFHEFCEHIN